MKFNPSTKVLSTHDGRLIKTLSCHLNVQLQEMQIEPDGHMRCEQCEHRVLDTALLSENQLVEIIEADPTTCLLVRRKQTNIEII